MEGVFDRMKGVFGRVQPYEGRVQSCSNLAIRLNTSFIRLSYGSTRLPYGSTRISYGSTRPSYDRQIQSRDTLAPTILLFTYSNMKGLWRRRPLRISTQNTQNTTDRAPVYTCLGRIIKVHFNLFLNVI